MQLDPWQIFKIYGLAILLGSLMGFERERKKTRLAGLRTFILVTLFGAICGQISALTSADWVLFGGMLAVVVQSAMMLVLKTREEISTGLTTSVALLVAFGIGILVALNQTLAAISLSLATTVILYFKPQMHQFTHSLSERDIYAIFQFCLIAFIILPVLPNRGFGPYQALNPYHIWLMVVMISAFNLIGYVVLKFAGQHWGGPVLGLLGGIVSSTATTLSFSRHARNHPEFSLMGAVVVSLASTVVLLRIALLIGIIHFRLINEMVLPLLVMFAVGLVAVLIIWRQTTRQGAPTPETRNPMELGPALLFGFLYALILVAVSAAEDYLGNQGVYLVSLVSGLTDLDAITLSNARIAAKGILEGQQAAIGILIAYVANLAFKLALIGTIGTRQMFRWALLPFIALALPALLVVL